MTRLAIPTTIVLAVLAIDPPPAAAQPRSRSAASPGAFEVAVGALWMKRLPLASGAANETTPGGTAFPLFTTSTSLGAMTGAEIQVGVHLGRHVEVFGAGSFGKRLLSIEAKDDVENASAVTASERVEQFTFTGGLFWFLTQSRVAPFISAEAGQLRERHEEQTLVESGLIYMLGGGVNIGFSNPSSDVGIGARVDARAMLRSKEFLLDSDRLSPAVTVSMFVRF